jgi:formate hydrogenlyase subunit 3/multisubunit Na+/H+ antiporter MnhD subunit
MEGSDDGNGAADVIVLGFIAAPLLAALALVGQPRSTGRWALAVVVVEVALLVVGLVGGVTWLVSQTVVVLGTELALRPAGILALAIAAMVTLVAVAAIQEEAAPSGLATSAVLGLAGVGLVGATSGSTVAAALAMIVVVAALSIAFSGDVLPHTARPPVQRFVIWLALGVTALLLAGVLDRFYLHRPGPGVLGPEAALFVVGVGITLASLPLSFWLPALAFEAPIGAGLAVGLLGAGTLSILAGNVAGSPWLLGDASARAVVVDAGAIAGLVSALLALGERHPSRVIAFLISASANLSLAELATAVPADPTGVILLIGAQSLAGALALIALGAAKAPVSGLFRRRPALTLGLGVASLSLVGLPLTAGSLGRSVAAPNLVGQHLLFLVTVTLTGIIGGLAVARALGPIFDASSAAPEPWRPLDLAALGVAVILVASAIVPGPLLALLAS